MAKKQGSGDRGQGSEKPLRPYVRYTIAIGNTSISMMGWGSSGRLDDFVGGGRSSARFIEILVSNFASALDGGCVVIGGVVPSLQQKLDNLLRKKRCPAFVFREDFQPHIEIVPEPAGRVGDDRIAAALGALTLDPNVPWVVVDLGTAVTSNAVTPARNGRPPRFEGGLIIPGAAMALKALSRNTAQLPELDAQLDDMSEFHYVGRSTEQAMRWGVAVSQVASVLAMIEGQKAALGPGTRVALTGGGAKALQDALKLAPHRKFDFTYHPFLVHLGLGAAWQSALK